MAVRTVWILCVWGMISLVAVSVCGAECRSYWSFDEGQGLQACDHLGGQDGYVSGAQWVEGAIGSALWFDGEDDYVSLPTNDPVWLPRGDFSSNEASRYPRPNGWPT